MAVLFKSTIEPNGLGSWRIKIEDTLSGEIILCGSVDEYADNIERMGMEYGGDIQVSWERDELITPDQFSEIERQMKKYQNEMEESQ